MTGIPAEERAGHPVIPFGFDGTVQRMPIYPGADDHGLVGAIPAEQRMDGVTDRTLLAGRTIRDQILDRSLARDITIVFAVGTPLERSDLVIRRSVFAVDAYRFFVLRVSIVFPSFSRG